MVMKIEFQMNTEGVETKRYSGVCEVIQNQLMFDDFESGDTYHFIFDEDQISMRRIGKVPLWMTFIQNQTTEAMFNHLNQEYYLTIQTRVIILEEYKYQILYDVVDNLEIVSKHEIYICLER